MAFPQVASITIYNGGGTQVTPHPIVMPATVNAGDLLIILFMMESGSSPTTPTDWDVLFGPEETDSGTFLVGYYKVADGSEDGATVNIGTTSTSYGIAHTYRITDWFGTFATGVSVGTVAEGSSSEPDPPTVTASWGSADNLFIACYGVGDDWNTSVAPSNYGNLQYDECQGSLALPSISSARRELAAATDDPGVFTAVENAAIWAAQTVVIRPVEAATFTAEIDTSLAKTSANLNTVQAAAVTEIDTALAKTTANLNVSEINAEIDTALSRVLASLNASTVLGAELNTKLVKTAAALRASMIGAVLDTDIRRLVTAIVVAQVPLVEVDTKLAKVSVALNVPIPFQAPALLHTGPRLATAYVHSPWWPRQRLAILTTANNIDRSYTAVSRLGTKDTGQAGLNINKRDPALLRDSGVLTHGNLLVITSPVAPPWVGVLTSTSEDDTSGQIELSAISYEAVLDGRVTPQGQKYVKPVGANKVFDSLIAESNARNHLGLMMPSITEITNPVEDLEVGGQSVLEALNELCGRTNSEWWLEYQVSPSHIKATVRLGFMQGFDLSARKHYYQGTHFTASYRQDMSQVKSSVTTIGDFGADLPDRNSVTKVGSVGPQHLGTQAAAIHQADVVASRRLDALPAGLRNEKVTFEVMTGNSSELSRRSGLVQERPLQAERALSVTNYSNVDWRDLAAGNIVTRWGNWGGVVQPLVSRVMGCQPDEEQGVCMTSEWVLVR